MVNSMFEGLEIVKITRVGHDYAIHFTNGTFALFNAEDIEPVLLSMGACLPDELKPHPTKVN
jgi:hypothetical protein